MVGPLRAGDRRTVCDCPRPDPPVVPSATRVPVADDANPELGTTVGHEITCDLFGADWPQFAPVIGGIRSRRYRLVTRSIWW